MANKVHIINIGGKERTLKFSFKAFRELSRRSALLKGSGKSVDWQVTVDDDSADGMTAMVWAGLTHEDKNLVPDTVAEWFDTAAAEGRDIFKEFVLEAKRALGESGATGTYFTYNEEGRFTKDLSGKDGAAVV